MERPSAGYSGNKWWMPLVWATKIVDMVRRHNPFQGECLLPTIFQNRFSMQWFCFSKTDFNAVVLFSTCPQQSFSIRLQARLETRITNDPGWQTILNEISGIRDDRKMERWTDEPSKWLELLKDTAFTADNINGLKFANSSSSIGVEGTLTCTCMSFR